MFCAVLSDGQVQLQEETERLRKNKSLLYSQVLERRHSMPHRVTEKTLGWSGGGDEEGLGHSLCWGF